jgi:hypothetical protein
MRSSIKAPIGLHWPSPQRIRGLLLTPPSRGQFFAD